MESISLGQYTFRGKDDSSCSLIMESDIEVFYWWIDLPSLTSFTSGGNSFYSPRFVTLSSLISNDWILNRYS